MTTDKESFSIVWNMAGNKDPIRKHVCHSVALNECEDKDFKCWQTSFNKCLEPNDGQLLSFEEKILWSAGEK